MSLRRVSNIVEYRSSHDSVLNISSNLSSIKQGSIRCELNSSVSPNMRQESLAGFPIFRPLQVGSGLSPNTGFPEQLRLFLRLGKGIREGVKSGKIEIQGGEGYTLSKTSMEPDRLAFQKKDRRFIVLKWVWSLGLGD